MSTGSIRLITTQKVLKTWNVKGMKQHYLGSNHQWRCLLHGEFANFSSFSFIFTQFYQMVDLIIKMNN